MSSLHSHLACASVLLALACTSAPIQASQTPGENIGATTPRPGEPTAKPSVNPAVSPAKAKSATKAAAKAASSGGK